MSPQDTKIFDEIQGLLSSVTEQEARKHIEDIEKQIGELQEERSKWGSLLILKNQLGEVTSAVDNGGGTETPTMREAIRRVLEDQPSGYAMKLAQIGKAIVERGWMEDIAKDWHRLQMMASNMKRQNQLERPKMGFYRLPLKDSRPEGEEPEG
jgi:hypothetical protein